MQFHQAWREASGAKYPLNKISRENAKSKDANHQRVKVDYNLEPKMCAEYLEVRFSLLHCIKLLNCTKFNPWSTLCSIVYYFTWPRSKIMFVTYVM